MKIRIKRKLCARKRARYTVITLLAYFFENVPYKTDINRPNHRIYTPRNMSDIADFEKIESKHVLDECKRLYGHKMIDFLKAIIKAST